MYSSNYLSGFGRYGDPFNPTNSWTNPYSSPDSWLQQILGGANPFTIRRGNQTQNPFSLSEYERNRLIPNYNQRPQPWQAPEYNSYGGHYSPRQQQNYMTSVAPSMGPQQPSQARPYTQPVPYSYDLQMGLGDLMSRMRSNYGIGG